MATDKLLPVIELFGPTLQGEGLLCGQISHFVRFGGCPRRCTWCDSMHAVLPDRVKENARWMGAEDISKELLTLRPSPWVTFSGGDPVMWDLENLVSRLMPHFRLAVETQGDIWRPWLKRMDLVTISPKPPSAGGEPPDYDVLERYVEELDPLKTVMKIVVFTEEDFVFARYMHRRHDSLRLFLSSGTPLPDEGEGAVTAESMSADILEGYRRLTKRVLVETNSFKGVTVLPQVHALIWGAQKGH